MERNSPEYQAYLQILKEELVPATGCTEPIAIAYAAAKAREVLGGMPQKVDIRLSGSIIKNAKSATVPGTGGRRGIQTAVAAGLCAGHAEKKLEVIASIPPEKVEEIARCEEQLPVEIGLTDGENLFEILLSAFAGPSVARVHLVGGHTQLVLVEKDGKAIYRAPEKACGGEAAAGCSRLSVADIIAFADAAAPEDLAPLARRQIEFNQRIAREGLENPYGANIGKTLLAVAGGADLRTRARAMAAAASDARMGGCDLPVIITAGSGNQGLASSLPVMVYAEAENASEELLHRALALAALVTVHQKDAIGKLSAFCGAVSAGAGAGAGIAYLKGGRYREISHTLVNALGILPGMVCDGAKPSCAAKIAMAVEAGILGYEMFAQGQQFYNGEGLVAADVEHTIANIGCLGKDGMRETDREILRMMTCESGL